MLVPVFRPEPPLISGCAHHACRAAVIIPARNEEKPLPAALDALRLQEDGAGQPLAPELYEVIVLLNNCTDASESIVRRYQLQYPAFNLHVAEVSFPPAVAHVGTARRLLMDTAWHRLQHSPQALILSTDADSTVAPDWVYQNQRCIEAGAEVVGGVIDLRTSELAYLDPGTRHAYRLDRRYQRNVAHLESLLDPDPADPWPRHLEHFGASLACTHEVYARAGGLPPISRLEDVAFIDACRRVDARIRHSLDVSVVTSARMDGRAETGLSGQLRRWREDSALDRPHLVQNAAYLTHRFTSMASLRSLRVQPNLRSLTLYPQCWHEPVTQAYGQHLGESGFLSAVDCDRLIDETFRGPREGPIFRVVADLDRRIGDLKKPAPVHSGETSLVETSEQYATPAG